VSRRGESIGRDDQRDNSLPSPTILTAPLGSASAAPRAQSPRQLTLDEPQPRRASAPTDPERESTATGITASRSTASRQASRTDVGLDASPARLEYPAGSSAPACWPRSSCRSVTSEISPKLATGTDLTLPLTPCLAR
jgi:hypothetical protein